MVEVPLWVVATGVAVVVLFVLVGAVAIGLYLGQRRTSGALENLARYGRTTEPPRAEAHQPKSPEQEVVEDIEERAVDELATDLQRRASRMGRNIDDETARKEAERMIRRGFAKAGGAE